MLFEFKEVSPYGDQLDIEASFIESALPNLQGIAAHSDLKRELRLGDPTPTSVGVSVRCT